MKILYLSNIPSPYRVDYFNELGKLCDLTVVYQAEYNSTLNSNWFSEKAQNFNAVLLKKGYINEKKIQPKIIKYIKKNQFDLIIVSTYSNPTEMLSILLLKLKGIPFVLEVDGGMPRKENYFKMKIKTYFISSAKHWLSTSNNTDQYLIYYGANKEQVFRYPFTSLRKKEILISPLNMESKLKIREKYGIVGNKVAIAVGQFIHRKGFDTLINAWSNVNPSNHLLIIGDGELKSKYVSLIRELNLSNITILDFMNKERLLDYYKSSDVFILPTREDIWGLVINEALANALPVITTDKCVAGLELVNDYENGFIIPNEDALSLSSRINLILENDMLREEMSRKSLMKMKNYTIENMAMKHYDLFTKFIK
jgi:glycosyltransferase involved in cell wall biosynthesis